MITSCNGLFISIEGPNGVGKSTFIERTRHELDSLGEVVFTKEPTKTRLALSLRILKASFQDWLMLT